MEIIRWNDSYSVNNEQIDSQHKNLVTIINRLAESMATGQGKDVLGKIIDLTMGLRVKDREEIEGLDTHLHEESGYRI